MLLLLLPLLLQEEEEPSRAPNRKLGRTNFFCPVAYKDLNVLKPGDPEVVARYKGLTYYLGGEREMGKFMTSPQRYVNVGIQYPLKVGRIACYNMVSS